MFEVMISEVMITSVVGAMAVGTMFRVVYAAFYVDRE